MDIVVEIETEWRSLTVIIGQLRQGRKTSVVVGAVRRRRKILKISPRLLNRRSSYLFRFD